ncbi:PE-PPE domain-containing protein [Mycolicibacterium sp. CR10]|uniref:PE-PPE domain-containing protein n=1 Tax=Mycolicibacterium sp. CR10 TaxID=2562314 RepID=UPI0010BFD0E5|nr:PE-PPE domain-containing protein [Mycolicibacterium sp. CR10]
MRSLFRSAGVTVVSLLGAFLLMVTTALPAMAGTTFVVGGIGQPTLLESTMNLLLNRKWKDDDLEDIYWPAQAKPFTSGTYTLGQSVAIGVTNLTNAIMTAEVPITVVGMSGGSLVVDETMRKLLTMGDDAPSKQDLTFYIIADSSRQSFINKTQHSTRLDYTYQPAPETKYDVVVVTGEYDGFADFPDRWWNFTAVLNAYAGIITEHIPTALANLDTVPADYITVTYNDLGGKTTHYLVPAKTLPLVKLFPSLKAREATLKVQIDSAYKRNDPVSAVSAATFAAPQELAATEDTEDESTPVAQKPPAQAAKHSKADAEDETVPDEELGSGSNDDEVSDDVISDDEESDDPAAEADAAVAEDDEASVSKEEADAGDASESDNDSVEAEASDDAPSADSNVSDS